MRVVTLVLPILVAACSKPDETKPLSSLGERTRTIAAGCNKQQTCTLVTRNLPYLDRVPKRYVAALTDAGKRCGS